MWVAFLCNDVSLGLMLFLSYPVQEFEYTSCTVQEQDEGAAVSAVPDVEQLHSTRLAA